MSWCVCFYPQSGCCACREQQAEPEDHAAGDSALDRIEGVVLDLGEARPGGLRFTDDPELGRIRYEGEALEEHALGEGIAATEPWWSGRPSGLWLQTEEGALLFTAQQLSELE